VPTNIGKYKSDLEVLVKLGDTMRVSYWGLAQHPCDHHKEREPTQQEVEELIKGVEKITKRLF